MGTDGKDLHMVAAERKDAHSVPWGHWVEAEGR